MADCARRRPHVAVRSLRGTGSRRAGIVTDATFVVGMAARSRISEAQWDWVLAERRKRPPTSWRSLAAELGVAHPSLIERYRRHEEAERAARDRKSTRLNSSHMSSSY